MILRFQAVALELARHAGAYVELGAAAAAEWRSAWKRRLAMLVVGATAGMAGVAVSWAAGLVALWDTRWRLIYLLISAALLLAVGTTMLYYALARRSSGPATGFLRSELRKDLELLQQWKSTL
jgi:hypothetical protein